MDAVVDDTSCVGLFQYGRTNYGTGGSPRGEHHLGGSSGMDSGGSIGSLIDLCAAVEYSHTVTPMGAAVLVEVRGVEDWQPFDRPRLRLWNGVIDRTRGVGHRGAVRVARLHCYACHLFA